MHCPFLLSACAGNALCIQSGIIAKRPSVKSRSLSFKEGPSSSVRQRLPVGHAHTVEPRRNRRCKTSPAVPCGFAEWMSIYDGAAEQRKLRKLTPCEIMSSLQPGWKLRCTSQPSQSWSLLPSLTRPSRSTMWKYIPSQISVYLSIYVYIYIKNIQESRSSTVDF